jgi:hypothetical protein
MRAHIGRRRARYRPRADAAGLRAPATPAPRASFPRRHAAAAACTRNPARGGTRKVRSGSFCRTCSQRSCSPTSPRSKPAAPAPAPAFSSAPCWRPPRHHSHRLGAVHHFVLQQPRARRARCHSRRRARFPVSRKLFAAQGDLESLDKLRAVVDLLEGYRKNGPPLMDRWASTAATLSTPLPARPTPTNSAPCCFRPRRPTFLPSWPRLPCPQPPTPTTAQPTVR